MKSLLFDLDVFLRRSEFFPMIFIHIFQRKLVLSDKNLDFGININDSQSNKKKTKNPDPNDCI